MNITCTLRKSNKKILITNLFFYLILILCVSYDLIYDTLLSDQLNPYLYVGILDFALPGIAVWTLINNYYNNKERTAAFFVFIYFLFTEIIQARKYISTFTYESAFTIVCLMVASKGHEYRRIAKVYVAVKGILLSLVTTLALIGVIQDLLFEETGRPDRHSLGFTYPLYCSSHWFTLALVYCYIRKGRLKVWEYVLLAGVWSLLFFLCKAQTASALLLLLILATFIRQVIKFKVNSKRFTMSPRFIGGRDRLMRVMKMSFIILMFIMIAGSIMYSEPVSSFFAKFPRISTFFSRFYYGREGILNYFPTIFGRSFPSYTDAVSKENGVYFSVDSSYILIPIYFGIIGVPFFLYGFKYIPERIYNKNDGYTLLLLSLFAILCAMEHRLFYLSYSIFWLMAFADLGKDDVVYVENNRDNGVVSSGA